MKYYEGLTLAEIAKILEIPLGTIKSSLNKALNILRIELKEEVLE
jgi:RNA polymerase sigma-70 factor (ECF subfamily)